MLEYLTIKDYALIEHMEVDFHHGLNILTGETGAGKSIILGALGLILGEKADTEAIRTGRDEAAVSAVVSADVKRQTELAELLRKKGIELEDSRLIIRRVVRRSGRGTAYIQSMPVPMKDLKEIAQHLFDIHGQHDHQSLLRGDTQRVLLDRYGNLEEEVLTVSRLYSTVQKLLHELNELSQSSRERLREKEMLEYAAAEIEEAGLKPGEEEELRSEIRRMENFEQLHTHVLEVRNCFRNSSSASITDLLKKASAELGHAAEIDTELQEESERLDALYYEAEDIMESLRHYAERITYSREELDSMQERLQAIRRLQKKYGDTVDDVLAYADDAKKRVNGFSHSEEREKELNQEILKYEQQLSSAAEALSEKRRETAEKLKKEVLSFLHVLGMPEADFSVELQNISENSGFAGCSPSGRDAVRYLIISNPGEPFKPVSQIASGGELSRIMLALKSAFAETDSMETLIFDEIDSGIGGNVAVSVGEHLAALGIDRQVICITHIASIAAYADKHFVVDKSQQKERTVTSIRPLDEEARPEEIARMLSGEAHHSSALVHARELIAQSRKRIQERRR